MGKLEYVMNGQLWDLEGYVEKPYITDLEFSRWLEENTVRWYTGHGKEGYIEYFTDEEKMKRVALVFVDNRNARRQIFIKQQTLAEGGVDGREN